MRVFSKGRLARATAHLLTLAFLWSIWLTGALAVPAAAQIVTRAATTQSVAVVPFENLSGIRPEVFGDEASDAVVYELRERLLLDVLPKADVTLQMRDLGLTLPLGDVELVRLASELEVALLVTGQVRAARILRAPEGRYAEIVLGVRLFDRVARADVNGALVTGKGPASADASDEVLIRKALAQAAFQAVEEMKSRPTITAMVLWARGDRVFLNVGSRGGVRPGVKMVAIRGGERISLVQVTDADATGAYADVVEGSALRTGDHLRAVYELPIDVRARPARVIERTGKRFEKVVLAAAILFGLGAHASRARLLEEGGIAAPDFISSNLANAEEMGFGGWITSYIFPNEMFPAAATITTWKPYSGTQKKRLIAYELFRSDFFFQFPIDIVVLEHESDNVYIDSYHLPGYYEVSFSVDPVTGILSDYETDFELYVPEYDNETGEWLPESWADFVEGNPAVIDATESDIIYGWVVGPDWVVATAGEGMVYRVRPLYIRQVQIGDGQYEWEFSRDAELSSPENFLVAVAPPTASYIHWTFGGYEQGVYEIWDWALNPEIAGNLATFYFYNPIGADQMIVQVTRDPNILFDPEGLYTQAIPAVSDPFLEHSVQVDLTQVPGTGDVFWWRIGARNRRSRVPPRPWPLSRTNDYGYVWSDRLSFIPTAASRASLLHAQREALGSAQMRGVRTTPRTTGSRMHRAE